MSSTRFGGFRLSEIGLQPLCDSQGLLACPSEMSIGVIQQLYYEMPLRTASVAMIAVLLGIAYSMSPAESFYRGETDAPPDEGSRWSNVLSGSRNGETRAIDGLIDAIKKYGPNDTPYQMANFKEMQYAIMFKLIVLQGVFGERTTVFERCISIYESAMAALVKPPSVTYTVEQRDRDVDRLREAYVKVDGLIVDFLAQYEESRLHPANAPASSEDVRQVKNEVRQVKDEVCQTAAITASTDRKVDDMRTTVNRIDRRDLESRGKAQMQNREKRRREQDEISAIVDEARNDYPLLQQSRNGKFSFELCFVSQHYRNRLKAHGVESPEALRSMMQARNNRLCRDRLKRLNR